MLKMFTRYLNIKKEEKQLPCISIQPFLIAPIYHFSNNLKDDTSKLIKIEGNDISLKFFIDYNLSETNTKEIIESEYDLKNTTVTLEKYYNDSSNEEENWIFQEYIQLPISGGDERRNNFGFIISDQLNMDTTKYDFDEKGMQLIYIFSDFKKKLRNESDLKKLVENFRLFLGLSNNSDWEKFKFQFTVIIKKKNTLEEEQDDEQEEHDDEQGIEEYDEQEEQGIEKEGDDEGDDEEEEEEYKIKSLMFQLNFDEDESNLELTLLN